MRTSKLSLVILVLTSLVVPAAGQVRPPQGATAASPTPLTTAQAQQAVDVLQDDAKRAQLIETLQAIAKATPPAGSSSVTALPSPATSNLGVQLLVQLSNWFGELSGQLAAAARVVTDLPT